MDKEKRSHGLLYGILIMIALAFILTWLVYNGQFSATGLVVNDTLTRLGINDIAWVIYYGLYFALDKIMMLLAIGGLYGVLSRTNAYERIVSGIARVVKHPEIMIVCCSVIIAALTSLLTQSFVVLLFVPFIISILNRMKVDKLTILATTFGSMLVGIMGATYGTDGLSLFNQYMGFTEPKVVLIRAGILVVGLLLFNFFTLNHFIKTKKAKNEDSTDIFVVELPENKKKKNSIIPFVIIAALMLIIVILGYVNWNAFGIEVFDNVYKFITQEIKIGDFYVINDILGANMGAFGTWDLFNISAITILLTLVLGACYTFKPGEFIDAYISGIKKVLLPAACVVGAFAVMIIVYMSPYVSTIVGYLLDLTEGFNLATMSLSSLIANIFHTDLGFTGYIMASYLTVEYADYINPIYVIFVSLYGFVQFFIPTSVILGIGLTSLNVKYTKWLKFVWQFLLGMLIVLLLIFVLMTLL